MGACCPERPIGGTLLSFFCMLISHTHTHTLCVHIYRFPIPSYSVLASMHRSVNHVSQSSRLAGNIKCESTPFADFFNHDYILHRVCVCDNIRTTNHIHEKVLSCHPTSCVCDNIRTIRSILSHCATLQHKSLSTDAVDT